MNSDIQTYHETLSEDDKAICNLLYIEIFKALPEAENKIWHAHPVWFLNGNPIVGYSKQKTGLRLMFWSGSDFEETDLNIRGAKFKDASIFYDSVADIDILKLQNWLEKSKTIQWDYKNIVKRKGVLERIS